MAPEYSPGGGACSNIQSDDYNTVKRLERLLERFENVITNICNINALWHCIYRIMHDVYFLVMFSHWNDKGLKKMLQLIKGISSVGWQNLVIQIRIIFHK